MSNMTELPEKLTIMLAPNANKELVKKVLAYLQSRAMATTTEISKETGISPVAVKGYLQAMQTCGIVDQERHGNARLFYLKEVD